MFYQSTSEFYLKKLNYELITVCYRKPLVKKDAVQKIPPDTEPQID